MEQVFLYGTLRHEGLLDIVLGSVPRERMQPATLKGFAVSRADGHGFPLIEAKEGAEAVGILLKDVSEQERARLDHYELGFGYRLHEVDIDGQTALVYMPEEGLWQAAEPWSLEAWSASDWPHVRFSAREIMSYLGQVDASDLAWRFAMIGARAHSRNMAQTEPSPTELRSDMSADAVEVLRRDVSHLGFFRSDTYKLRHPRFDGTMSDSMEREVFIGADAALVLPYDAKRDRVMLVEQFRMGPFARGDAHPWILEPIAGRVDAGESPEDAASRECLEEAGLSLSALLPIARCYASPGEVSTYFHMFLGLADLPDDSAGIGGLEGEQEDIKSHVISFERAMDLVRSGEINIGPLIQMLQWLALNKAQFEAQS